MRQGLFMSLKEQKDLDIIYQVLRFEICSKEASFLLNKSYRQTLRIIEKIKNKGILGIKHGNLNKVPINKFDEDFKNKFLQIYKESFYDHNLIHALEKINKQHGLAVSYETFRTWAHEINLVKRRHKKSKPRIHKTRPRMPQSGMMLQLDGSHHDWFNNGIKPVLIANIDDATSHCCHAEFFPAEDRIAVLTVMKATIEKYGIPEYLYVDQAACHGKDGIFRKHVNYYNHITDLERAMLELGCRVLFAHSPQAKGRIERMWNTFQDRLIPELRCEKINRIPSANIFLKKNFVPDFNLRFSKPAYDPKPAWKPVPENLKNKLDEIFCIKEYRKVSFGETISWRGKEYLIEHNFIHSLRKMVIELRTYIDGKTKAFYAGKEVSIEESGLIKVLAS